MTNVSWMIFSSATASEDLGDELTTAPCILGVTAVGLENDNELLTRAVEADVGARAFGGQLAHGLARPRAGQVDVDALVVDLERARGGPWAALM